MIFLGQKFFLLTGIWDRRNTHTFSLHLLQSTKIHKNPNQRWPQKVHWWTRILLEIYRVTPHHTSAIKYVLFCKKKDHNRILIFGPTLVFPFFFFSDSQSLICSTVLMNSKYLLRTLMQTPPYDHWKKKKNKSETDLKYV